MSGESAAEPSAGAPQRGHWTVFALAALASLLWVSSAVSGVVHRPDLITLLPGMVVGSVVAGWIGSRAKLTGREAGLVLAAAHALLFGGAALLSCAMANTNADLSQRYALAGHAEFGAWFGALLVCGMCAVACLRTHPRVPWIDGLAVPVLLAVSYFVLPSSLKFERVGLPYDPGVSFGALLLLVYVSARSSSGGSCRSALARFFGALALGCGAHVDLILSRPVGLSAIGPSPVSRFGMEAFRFDSELAEGRLLIGLSVALAAGFLLTLLRSPRFSARGLLAVGFAALLGASTLLAREVRAEHAVMQRHSLAAIAAGQPAPSVMAIYLQSTGPPDRPLTIEPLAAPLFGYRHPMRKDATGASSRLLDPALVRALDVDPQAPIGALELPSE